MKRKKPSHGAKRLALLILVILLGLNCRAFTASLHPNVQVISTHSIILDTESPLSEYYEGDFSALGFTTEEAAYAFFGGISDNLMSYEVNYTAKTVTIHLYLDRADPGWTITDWNAYIHQKLNP